MKSTDAVILKIKPVWDSNNTLDVINKAVNNTKSKVDELNKSCCETQSIFKSVFKADFLMRGVVAAKNALVGFTKSGMDAYQKQNVAQTQLGAVMKNTMGAGKWDVEDIVALTKAQQKLGVVSSDVQLAGAKELGTYTKKKSSLERLIPTMNDMLAHQYGLNASQENAYGIAQMMGKVLEGQTTALSRNGYFFTEAQEKILKYGSESDRVSVLMEVVAQSVKGVNEALAATPEGKAKQIEMEYNELKIRVGELVTKLKTEGLVYLHKHQNAVVGIAKVTGSAAASLAMYNIVVKGHLALVKASEARIAALTVLKRLYKRQVDATTGSVIALTAAQKASGIGAILAVVTAAATAFALFRKRTKESTDAMKVAKEVYSSFYEKERTQLDILFAKLEQTNPKSEERKRLVREIAGLYPELNKQTLNDITNTNNLTAAYDALSTSIQKKALAKSHENAMQSAYKKGAPGEAILRGAVGYELGDKKLLQIARQYLVAYKNRTKGSQGVVDFTKENVRAVKAFVEGRDEARSYSKLIAGNTGGINSLNNSTNGYTSTASDAITGGGKQVKNFYINIGSLIGENTNRFESSKDDPQSAQDFTSKLSETLQKVVNDVNYAAA